MGEVSKDAIKTSRTKAWRTQGHDNPDAYKKHVIQIGEIIYLWNRLQNSMFMIFWGIADRRDYSFAHSLWHSQGSDGSQRSMIERSAKSRLKTRMANNVLWICKKHEALAPYRNAFAHVGFYYSLERQAYSPEDFSAKSGPIDLLTRYPKEELFTKLRGDLTALGAYAESIGFRLVYVPSGATVTPWLEKPRLRLSPETPMKRSKALRRAKAKEQTPPPSPSQA